MAFYAASFDRNTSGVTTTPLFHVACAGAGGAGGSVRVVEAYIAGQATTSSPIALGINRPTASGTPSTASTTAQALDNNSGNHSFWLYGDRASTPVAYTTAPTVAAGDVLNLAFNAYGGLVRWAALPGAEIVAVATATTAGTASGANLLLARQQAGSAAAVSGHFIIEQR